MYDSKSSDITSFVCIGDEKHHLSKWLIKEKKWPQQKETVLSLLSDWRKQRRFAKNCLINHSTVSKFKKRFYCGARLKTYNKMAGKHAQVHEVIASFCGLLSRIDRSRQLMRITTVNRMYVNLFFVIYIFIKSSNQIVKFYAWHLTIYNNLIVMITQCINRNIGLAGLTMTILKKIERRKKEVKKR